MTTAWTDRRSPRPLGRLLTPGPYLRWAARRTAAAGCLVEAARDARRLGRLPVVEGYAEAADRIRRRTGAEHARYVSRVSTVEMAISLEVAVLCRWLCERTRPGRILDLGSGLSSAVFRRHALESDDPVEVWSVDSDPGWLDRTRDFLAQEDLPTERVVGWDEFRRRTHEPFDLILHDLGHTGAGELRPRALPGVLDWVAPRGWIVVDDAHHHGYGREARRILRAQGFEAWSTRRFTRDRFNRYALLATRAGEHAGSARP